MIAVRTNESTDIQVALDAIDQAKRRLSPVDRCCAEMHDDKVLGVTLKALRQKRGQLDHKDRFAERVAFKDMRRRINRERSRSRNKGSGEYVKTKGHFYYVSSSPDPFIEACRREEAEKVGIALSQLPGDQENVLRSLYFGSREDQNLCGLAERLGVTRQTVARWLDQGHTTLGRLLQGHSE